MPKTKGKRYVVVKDIVIPAGTEMYEGPSEIRYAVPHIDTAIGFGPDITGHFLIDADEALETGYIKELI